MERNSSFIDNLDMQAGMRPAFEGRTFRRPAPIRLRPGLLSRILRRLRALWS